MTNAFTASGCWPGRHQTACKIAPVSSPCAPCEALAQTDTKLEAQEDGAERQWAHLPVIEQVLQYIATGDSAGSSRDMFAIAGVCKHWRAAAQEVFFSKTWQQPSATITHPCQLYTLCPLPMAKGGHITCFVKREALPQSAVSKQPKYLLFQGGDFSNRGGSRFLLAALQDIGTRSFTIFMDRYCIGKPIARLSGNLLGTGYDLISYLGSSSSSSSGGGSSGSSSSSSGGGSSGSSSSSGEPGVALHVGYKLRMRGMMLPRRMHATIPSPRQRQQQQQVHHLLHNKAPHWNDALRCWCLNFRGRVKLASVKNFQLVTDCKRQRAAIVAAAYQQLAAEQRQQLESGSSNPVRDSSSSSGIVASDSSSGSSSSEVGLPGAEISAISSSSSSSSNSTESEESQIEPQLERLVTRAVEIAFAAAAAGATPGAPRGSPYTNSVVVQFGKVDNDVFILDYDPVLASALQAFATALTTFGNKVLL